MLQMLLFCLGLKCHNVIKLNASRDCPLCFYSQQVAYNRRQLGGQKPDIFL